MRKLIRITLSITAFSLLVACNKDETTADGVSTNEASAPVEAAEPIERYVNEIDLMPLIKRYLSPEGYMDPEFPPTVAMPSAYLTDFYGAQAIGDVSRDEIVADFVPRYAEFVEEDEHSVTLKFKDGFTAEFYPVSTLSAMGQEAEISHVVLSGDTWKESRGNVQKLIDSIVEIGREDAYLVDNHWFEREQTTYELMQKNQFAEVIVDDNFEQFFADDNGIFLLTESVHGNPKDAEILFEILKNGGIDWVGLEMLGIDQQNDIDAFNDAIAGTPEYDDARAKLVEYFETAWNGRAGPKTTGEENYYFKLCEAAHAAGARVVALEGTDIEFLFFRYGETVFGAGARSLVWAEATPPEGRGVIFGGGSHYNQPTSINVQDFIAAEDPDRNFYALKKLRPDPE